MRPTRTLWLLLLALLWLPALAEAQVTYLDRVTLSRDNDFRARVEYAAISTALGIVNEPGDTANHAQRMVMAKRLLGDPTAWATRIALAVVYHLTTATPTDADIQTATNSALVAFAKAEVMP